MAQQNQNQQDLREILQIRRDKLAALQEAVSYTHLTLPTT